MNAQVRRLTVMSITAIAALSSKGSDHEVCHRNSALVSEPSGSPRRIQGRVLLRHPRVGRTFQAQAEEVLRDQGSIESRSRLRHCWPSRSASSRSAGKDINLQQWTVGRRGFGTVFVFLLLAGEIYTTFTFLGGSGFALQQGRAGLLHSMLWHACLRALSFHAAADLALRQGASALLRVGLLSSASMIVRRSVSS